MAGGGGHSILGQILVLDSKSATIVFIGVLVFFILFEALLHVFEVQCDKRGFKGLVKKLYREFMIMGIISFIIYIASEISDFPNDIWFNAFNFAHIVLMFIGLTFLFQAALLVSLITSRNKVLLRHANSTSDELITEYVSMHKSGGLSMFMFDHGPVSIPFPELREKIEYKILQQFFIKVYNLPHEFKFANYMCRVLKDYVVSLVEVRPINWLIMSAAVALNYLKIVIVDQEYQHDLCEKYPAKNLLATHAIHHMRRLAGGGGSSGGSSGDPTYGADAEPHADPYAEASHGTDVCDEYVLRYAFVVLMMIGLYLLAVLIASEIYTKRLITIVLDQQEAEEKLGEKAALTAGGAGLNRGLSFKTTKRGSHLLSDGVAPAVTVPVTTPVVVPNGNGDIEMAGLGPTPSASGRTATTPDGLSLDTDELAPPTELDRVDSRRNRYIDALERLMTAEIDHQAELAKRMSLTEHDHHTRSEMASAAASFVSHKSEKSVASSGKFGSFMTSFYQPGGSSRANSVPLPGHAVHRGSNSSAGSAQPTGEELRARFQRMQTLGQELKEVRAQPVPQSAIPSIPFRLLGQNSGTATPGSPGTPSKQHSSGRGRTGTLFSMFSTHEAIPVPPVLDTHSHSTGSRSPAGGRARGYSVNFFDMRPAMVETPAPADGPKTCGDRLSACGTWLSGVLSTGAKMFVSMLVEHHIGQAHDHVHEEEDIRLLKKTFNTLFAFSQPELYYIAVEMALLIQCVYIALWATNFVSMASDSHFPIRWQLLLVFPLPLNFFLLKQIIFSSCTLKSILSIDKAVADKICEDAVDEQNVTQRLRRLIRQEMNRIAPELNRMEAKQFLKEKFSAFQTDDDFEGVDEKNLKLFLHSLQIFLTDASIRGIFGVIDFDQDGMVTWDDLCKIIFPDLLGKKVKVNKRASMQNKKRLSFDLEHVESTYTLPSHSARESFHEDLVTRRPGLMFARSVSNISVSQFTGSFRMSPTHTLSNGGSPVPPHEGGEGEAGIKASGGSEGDLANLYPSKEGEVQYYSAQEEAAQFGVHRGSYGSGGYHDGDHDDDDDDDDDSIGFERHHSDDEHDGHLGGGEEEEEEVKAESDSGLILAGRKETGKGLIDI